MRAAALLVVGLTFGCGSTLQRSDGAAGAGGGGSGGSGGAAGRDCAMDATYRYGDTGGLVAYEDLTTLGPDLSYVHTRTSHAGAPDISCAPPLPAAEVVRRRAVRPPGRRTR